LHNVSCPNCHQLIAVHGNGRPQLGLSLINVCEAVRACPTAKLSAKKLGCSEGYVFKVLKLNGLKLKEVRSGKN
jgi:hypothetical protein